MLAGELAGRVEMARVGTVPFFFTLMKGCYSKREGLSVMLNNPHLLALPVPTRGPPHSAG